MNTEPVKVMEPIIESPRERTFKLNTIPTFYRVEVVCPDGTTKVFERVRKYTKGVCLKEMSGHIEIEVARETAVDGIMKELSTRIPYPYHYLHAGKVLCSLKLYAMENRSDDEKKLRGFGLNYNLFNLPWQLCIILHKVGDEVLAFATSRMEWDRGDLSSDTEEVQMFLKVPMERHVPVDLMKLMVDSRIVQWMDGCLAEVEKKRSRGERKNKWSV